MIATSVALMTIWFLLARRLDAATLAVGVVAVVLVCAAQVGMFRKHDRLVATLLRHPLHSLRYLGTLAWRFIISTGYTIRLILLGREEGRIVALPLRLRHPIGRLLLLNSITLTPSTISLLVEADLLYFHGLRRENDRGNWGTIRGSSDHRRQRIFPGAAEEKHLGQ